jgi:hypothetical protein
MPFIMAFMGSGTGRADAREGGRRELAGGHRRGVGVPDAGAERKITDVGGMLAPCVRPAFSWQNWQVFTPFPGLESSGEGCS